MTSASTTVKIVVSMVVVAALVATRFSSKTSNGLKGTRKLQNGLGGITLASSQGFSDSVAALNAGMGADEAGNTGNSFGNGDAVGTSNGFVFSNLGQAVSSGTSGGNSTANAQLTTTLALTNGTGSFLNNTGSGGFLSSVGQGGGSAGGNAVFGPSLAAAILAATPVAAPAVAAVAVSSSSSSKRGKDNDDSVPAAPTAPTAPDFAFNPNGLPTGGGGGGFGFGSGVTTGGITSNVNGTSDEAYGSALANGFGFGVGSGLAINAGGESAGGQGGGTALGVGQFVFELDDVPTATFANSGVTTSTGGAGGYVGFNPPAAQIFGAFITPPPAATP